MRCLRILLNTKDGMDIVQKEQKLVNIIASALDTSDVKCKTTSLEILAAIW